jgi:CheY-like chemotaxis protein
MTGWQLGSLSPDCWKKLTSWERLGDDTTRWWWQVAGLSSRLVSRHNGDAPMGDGSGMDILLVEDSPSDAKLTSRWLKESDRVGAVHAVSDGEQALAFLRRQDAFANAPRARLVLLDVNLPRMSGFEVLAEIRKDVALSQLPVIMLSSSNFADDRGRAREMQADLYVLKPGDADEFAALVDTVEAFLAKGEGQRTKDEAE